jgi:hypothetical protein
MAAYIDLNPVRAGIVEDPKEYRFSGYAEAVAGDSQAKRGLAFIWADSMKLKNQQDRSHVFAEVLQAHRLLIFGKGASPWTHKGKLITHETAVKVLEKEQGQLPKTVQLRCRVRYFTDGAILGSTEFYRRLAARAGTKASSEGEQNKRSRLGRRGCNSKFTATGVWVIKLDA